MNCKTHSMKEVQHNKSLAILGSVFLSLASLSFLTGCPSPLQDSSQKTNQIDQIIDTSAITAAGYLYYAQGYSFKGEACCLVMKDNNYYFWSIAKNQIVSSGFKNVYKTITIFDEGVQKKSQDIVFKGERAYIVTLDSKQYFLSALSGEIVGEGVSYICDGMRRFKNELNYIVGIVDGVGSASKSNVCFLSSVTGIYSEKYSNIEQLWSSVEYKGEDCVLVKPQDDTKWYFLSTLSGEIISGGYPATSSLYTPYREIFYRTAFKNENCYLMCNDLSKYYFVSPSTGACVSAEFDEISKKIYQYEGQQFYSVKKEGIGYLLSLADGSLDNPTGYLQQIGNEYLQGFMIASTSQDKLNILQAMLAVDMYGELLGQNVDYLTGFQSPVGNATLVYGVSNKYVSEGAYSNRPIYMPKVVVRLANGQNTIPISQVENIVSFIVNGVPFLKITGYYDDHGDSWYEGDYYINADTGKVIAVANASDGVRLVQSKLVVESEFNEFWWTGSHGSTYYDLFTGELLPASQYQADYQAATSVVIEEGSSVTF